MAGMLGAKTFSRPSMLELREWHVAATLVARHDEVVDVDDVILPIDDVVHID